tara:strand:+ start:69003 stop:69506 length:504 start_codon:yes stop_codon:yes gene_type:complete
MEQKKRFIDAPLIVAVLVCLATAGYFGYKKFYQEHTPHSDITVSTAETSAPLPGKDLKVFGSTSITRAALDDIFSDLTAVMMSARAVPQKSEDGETIEGFKLSDIQPDSLWTKFGFQNEDTILQLNEDIIDSADAAMNVYTTLKSANNFKFKIVRGNETGVLEIKVD